MNIINQFTLRTLMKNKVRTLVTIIGIILSTAMFTAVTISISSFQNFMVDRTIHEQGNWYGSIHGMSSEQLNDLKQDKEISRLLVSENIGYAILEESMNDFKPYLFVQAVTTDFINNMPVHLTEGRLPKDPTEIILPTHLHTNGGISHTIGDVLSLNLGNRMFENNLLHQYQEYVYSPEGSGEVFLPTEEATYTVVGFYERPHFEDYTAPGYSALTLMGETTDNNHTYSSYVMIDEPKEIYTFLESHFEGLKINFNYNLLRLIDGSDDRGFNGVLYGLSSILILIIMFGSISLIYNAFSISVSERTKELGLLSSIGATKKQILRSVFFEALVLSGIGFPLGILSGIVGIGITLKLSQDVIQNVISSKVNFELAVSFPAIIIAIGITLITVLISAYIPARKVLKIPAIEAIRQTGDIHMQSKKVKTSKFTYRFFGFEGMIASKNFKRNKKKYRATVLSLFMSIVLFISASSFTTYLLESTGAVMNESDADLSYSYYPEKEGSTIDAVLNILKDVEGVSKYSRVDTINMPVHVDLRYLSEDYLAYMAKQESDTYINTEDGYVELSATLSFVDDLTYDAYVNEHRLSPFNSNQPSALVEDRVTYYSDTDNKYHSIHLLNTSQLEVDLLRLLNKEGVYYTGSTKDDDGQHFYLYNDETGNETAYSIEEAADILSLSLLEASDIAPFGVSYQNFIGLDLVLPMRVKEDILGDNRYLTSNSSLYFKTTDYKIVYDKMFQVLTEEGEPPYRLVNELEYRENSRALVTLIKIFSYGFIVLISLIATANVFNTISTNISLRRREFGMLQSMGMTQKGFRKMMYFECLLYGLKGLLYGLPVSFGITYLIYLSVNQGFVSEFFLPWSSIFIAISSVFLVVFATMLYSVMKLKKENTIDALKNDVI